MSDSSSLAWPLYSPELTSLHQFRGLPGWKAPDTSAVVEPTLTDADRALVEAVRSGARESLQQHGLTVSDELKSPLKSTHWRDIYYPNRHRTAVVATPDPRLAEGYKPPPVNTDWPDWYLMQFLVARKRNAAKATRMLLDCTQWWAVFGMDDLCAQPVCPFADKVATFYPERMHGVDKEGRPLIVGAAGRISLSAYHAAELPLEAAYIVQAYKRELLRRSAVEASVRLGRRVTNLAVVSDLDGFTIAHRIGIPWVRNQAFIDANFYPETAGIVLVLNAPGFFSWIFSILKSFIDPPTQEKIHILSSHYHSAVQQRLLPEWTPREWGGQCSHCVGACLPVNLTVDDREEKQRQVSYVSAIQGEADRTSVVINPRDSHEVRHRVEGKDHEGETEVDRYTVWWSWTIAAKDVEFSVSFSPVDGQPVQLVPAHRVSADEAGEVHRGCHTLTVGSRNDSGEIVITWSNSFSMWSSKSVSVATGVRKE